MTESLAAAIERAAQVALFSAPTEEIADWLRGEMQRISEIKNPDEHRKASERLARRVLRQAKARKPA
jgi:hypothetical protein